MQKSSRQGGEVDRLQETVREKDAVIDSLRQEIDILQRRINAPSSLDRSARSGEVSSLKKQLEDSDRLLGQRDMQVKMSSVSFFFFFFLLFIFLCFLICFILLFAIIFFSFLFIFTLFWALSPTLLTVTLWF
jgi:Flp pilus assembly protein TadB